MSMKVGVNNVVKNVIDIPLGVSNVKRLIKEGYVGVNNVSRKFWDSKLKAEDVTHCVYELNDNDFEAGTCELTNSGMSADFIVTERGKTAYTGATGKYAISLIDQQSVGYTGITISNENRKDSTYTGFTGKFYFVTKFGRKYTLYDLIHNSEISDYSVYLGYSNTIYGHTTYHSWFLWGIFSNHPQQWGSSITITPSTDISNATWGPTYGESYAAFGLKNGAVSAGSAETGTIKNIKLNGKYIPIKVKENGVITQE